MTTMESRVSGLEESFWPFRLVGIDWYDLQWVRYAIGPLRSLDENEQDSWEQAAFHNGPTHEIIT